MQHLKTSGFIIAILCMIVAASLSMPSSADAADIPLSALVADVSYNLGDGLNGAYYNSSSSFSTVSDAIVWAAANSPTGTFISTAVDYPNGDVNVSDDTIKLSDFLGSDVSSYTGTTGSLDDTLETSVFQFTGYIMIESSGSVSFSVGSDDGFNLSIGGVTVAEHSTPRAFGITTQTAVFASAGIYEIVLTYFENGGATGIEFSSSSLGGIVPTANLSTSLNPVPEPATLVLLGFGLIGTAALRRRHG